MAFLEFEVDNHIATLRLNDPKRHNALGPEFWDEMAPTMQRLSDDSDVRVVVVRGEGASFTSGLDFAAMLPKLPIATNGGPPDGDRQRRLHQVIRGMQAAISSVERCPKPVIAALTGACIGGGIDLACACDFRLASADVKFSVRETRLAIVADVGTLQRLPAIVGPGITRELVFTGRDFGAAYAAEIGLVNRVLPTAEALREEALRVAAEIAANPPLTVQGAKQVLNEARRADIDRGLEYVATYNAAHLVTQDLGVAVTAAMTKQTPSYEGR